jgi:AraC-like DNA-binding protein
MDALSSILEVIKLECIVCDKHLVKGPWGLDIVQQGTAQFWRLIKGHCMVGLYDNQVVRMDEGDIVFVPHGASHWIADSASSRRVTVDEYVKASAAGVPFFSESGEETLLVGGYFRFEEHQKHPFLRDLPPLIHITRFGTLHHQLLEHTAQIMHAELSVEKPGGHSMLRSLAEMLFVSIIRTYLEQSVAENGFLSALNDPQISKALKYMHDDPAQDWTLQSLAKSVAMSRSVFAGKFKQLVGETPLTYLTNWRINRAKELLVSEKSNVSEVAFNVGYQSEAAFNRVFKARTGKTPAMYRRSK